MPSLPFTTQRHVEAAEAAGKGDRGDSIDDVDRLRLVLLRLARRIRTNSSGTLTPSQLTVLATVSRHGRLTVGQIADIEHVKPPSVSKIVATLEHIGFVTRETEPTDRRRSFIVPTTSGGAFLDEARAAGRTFLAQRIAETSDADVALLAAALPALERLLGSVE